MGEPGRERAGAGVAFGLILVLLVLCGGGYAAAYVGSSDKVPRGTAIAGVDIGGLTPGAAEAKLRRDLGARADTTFGVVVDDLPAPVVPGEAGLGIDYAASVRQVVSGRSWHPKRLWNYYTGGESVEPVTTLDESAFDDWVAAMDTRVGHPPREGAVYFDGTRIVTTQPRAGLALDVGGTRDALQAAYLSALGGQHADPVELPAVTRDPEIGTDDVQRAVRDFANPAMSGPVTLNFDHARIRFNPEEYADALSLVPKHGHLRPTVDASAFDDVVQRAISGSAAPVPATVRLVHGRPKVIPDKPGVSYRRADVADALRKVVQRRAGHREIEVPSRSARSDFRTKDAKALGITEKVSSFTTYFPYADYRNTNIGRAAELVDGTVLKPGQTFSLNDTVGKRTRKNGFTTGFVISDGIYAQELGGGVSQLATTIFNAMYFAGLEDVEHKPHSFYIDRYPVGREATVAWGSVDLRFRDDTPHGVLISAHVTPSTPSSQGVVTVSMWSTKTWDITSSTGDRYHLTKPATRVLHTADCYPNTGYDGFDIDVTRSFHQPGKSAVDHTETFHTHYIPADTVICKSPR